MYVLLDSFYLIQASLELRENVSHGSDSKRK